MNPFSRLKDEVESLKQRLSLHQHYHSVFESPQGKAVLHDLLAACGMFRTSQDSNPHTTAFNEGKRVIALHILDRMRLDKVEAIQHLLEEKANDNQRPEQRLGSEEPGPILD